ncbi:MAG: hypothetical protein Q8P15_01340 [Nanoarchaeota archaeon]|nr:hypothetical protein [Nanoarchaeota archaeon]
MDGFNKKEITILKKLNTPSKIQDFLEELEINFEKNGDTCVSPKKVLETGKAHCIEAAIFACAALKMNNYPPLVVDLTANDKDYDHVIAVFKKGKFWGAISKSNRAILKYRDPIYKSIRELVMSYFNEYFTDDGKKTLRSYSMPVNLDKFNKLNWMCSDENIWFIPEYLLEVKHFPIVSKKQVHSLRKTEAIEVHAGKIQQWKPVGEKATKIKYKRDKISKMEV